MWQGRIKKKKMLHTKELPVYDSKMFICVSYAGLLLKIPFTSQFKRHLEFKSTNLCFSSALFNFRKHVKFRSVSFNFC